MNDINLNANAPIIGQSAPKPKDIFRVEDEGIYALTMISQNEAAFMMMLPKEVFVEAYNKYIVSDEQDAAD